jgi:hypothetical protein
MTCEEYLGLKEVSIDHCGQKLGTRDTQGNSTKVGRVA